jgi:hypothetical protein
MVSVLPGNWFSRIHAPVSVVHNSLLNEHERGFRRGSLKADARHRAAPDSMLIIDERESPDLNIGIRHPVPTKDRFQWRVLRSGNQDQPSLPTTIPTIQWSA